MNKRGSFFVIAMSVAFTFILSMWRSGAGAAPAAPTGIFISATKVNLIANDIIYAPGRDVIWVSVPSSGGSCGNSVVPTGCDGALGENIYVGRKPNKLALSDNDPYRTVGLDDAVYEVSGQVTDADGHPLFSIMVSAGAGYDDLTGENGLYTLSVPAGEYTLTASSEDLVFEPATRQITVPPDLADQNFVGWPWPSYSISGKIVDESGQPLAGITITRGLLSKTVDGTFTPSGWPVDFRTTDADGNYTYDRLLAGIHHIEPYQSGYYFEPHFLLATVPPDATGIDFVRMDKPKIFMPVIQQ